MGKKKHKATNMVVTSNFLQSRTKFLRENNWPKSKWIFFCEEMMRLGFSVELYEARQTKSKYCTVRHPDHRSKAYKVRFSDHKPIYQREMAGDCDFFVGHTHTGIRTTQDAINAVCNHFGIQRVSGIENRPVSTGLLVDFL